MGRVLIDTRQLQTKMAGTSKEPKSMAGLQETEQCRVLQQTTVTGCWGA